MCEACDAVCYIELVCTVLLRNAACQCCHGAGLPSAPKVLAALWGEFMQSREVAFVGLILDPCGLMSGSSAVAAFDPVVKSTVDVIITTQVSAAVTCQPQLWILCAPPLKNRDSPRARGCCSGGLPILAPGLA